MKPVDKAAGGGGPNERHGESGCALCARPVVEKYSPFCSKHCADIDLGRWLKGQYAVPGIAGDAGETPSGEQ